MANQVLSNLQQMLQGLSPKTKLAVVNSLDSKFPGLCDSFKMEMGESGSSTEPSESQEPFESLDVLAIEHGFNAQILGRNLKTRMSVEDKAVWLKGINESDAKLRELIARSRSRSFVEVQHGRAQLKRRRGWRFPLSGIPHNYMGPGPMMGERHDDPLTSDWADDTDKKDTYEAFLESIDCGSGSSQETVKLAFSDEEDDNEVEEDMDL